VILFTAEPSQRFSSKQIHNPGHNLKGSAVKKFKGSAVKKIQRFRSKQIISKVQQ
jgi:hypothetical protein